MKCKLNYGIISRTKALVGLLFFVLLQGACFKSTNYGDLPFNPKHAVNLTNKASAKKIKEHVNLYGGLYVGKRSGTTKFAKTQISVEAVEDVIDALSKWPNDKNLDGAGTSEMQAVVVELRNRFEQHVKQKVLEYVRINDVTSIWDLREAAKKNAENLRDHLGDPSTSKLLSQWGAFYFTQPVPVKVTSDFIAYQNTFKNALGNLYAQFVFATQALAFKKIDLELEKIRKLERDLSEKFKNEYQVAAADIDDAQSALNRFRSGVEEFSVELNRLLDESGNPHAAINAAFGDLRARYTLLETNFINNVVAPGVDAALKNAVDAAIPVITADLATLGNILALKNPADPKLKRYLENASLRGGMVEDLNFSDLTINAPTNANRLFQLIESKKGRPVKLVMEDDRGSEYFADALAASVQVGIPEKRFNTRIGQVYLINIDEMYETMKRLRIERNESQKKNYLKRQFAQADGALSSDGGKNLYIVFADKLIGDASFKSALVSSLGKNAHVLVFQESIAGADTAYNAIRIDFESLMAREIANIARPLIAKHNKDLALNVNENMFLNNIARILRVYVQKVDLVNVENIIAQAFSKIPRKNPTGDVMVSAIVAAVKSDGSGTTVATLNDIQVKNSTAFAASLANLDANPALFQGVASTTVAGINAAINRAKAVAAVKAEIDAVDQKLNASIAKIDAAIAAQEQAINEGVEKAKKILKEAKEAVEIINKIRDDALCREGRQKNGKGDQDFFLTEFSTIYAIDSAAGANTPEKILARSPAKIMKRVFDYFKANPGANTIPQNTGIGEIFETEAERAIFVGNCYLRNNDSAELLDKLEDSKQIIAQAKARLETAKNYASSANWVLLRAGLAESINISENLKVDSTFFDTMTTPIPVNFFDQSIATTFGYEFIQAHRTLRNRAWVIYNAKISKKHSAPILSEVDLSGVGLIYSDDDGFLTSGILEKLQTDLKVNSLPDRIERAILLRNVKDLMREYAQIRKYFIATIEKGDRDAMLAANSIFGLFFAGIDDAFGNLDVALTEIQDLTNNRNQVKNNALDMLVVDDVALRLNDNVWDVFGGYPPSPVSIFGGVELLRFYKDSEGVDPTLTPPDAPDDVLTSDFPALNGLADLVRAKIEILYDNWDNML